METEKIESEANMFALALLMPKDEFIKQLKKEPIDLADDNGRLKEIAKYFGVTTFMIAARMSMLGIHPHLVHNRNDL